jgi:phosphatidate cytidylyltransferase
MLAQRIITAVIGIVAAIFIINYGQGVFAAAALILTALAWHEFYNMMVKREIEVAYFLGLTGVVLLWAIAWLGNPQETVAVILLAVLTVLAKTVLAHASFTLRDAAYTVTGILYVGLSFSHLVLLRYTDQSVYIATKLGGLSAGAVYLWLAFIGTWASDTFAFFVGSRFGRHKLAPAVSPGKTWEGVAGGLAGSIVGVSVMGSLCYLSLVHCLAIGLMVGVVAPLGDLVESSIKRFAGVKDSGRLLPGHGGVLDRFDSIMFVAPAVYYYLSIFVIR